MVNLVVRHNSSNNHLQGTLREKAIHHHTTPQKNLGVSPGRERVVPSPIRVPALSHSNSRRPVSPLTTSGSLFGNMGPQVDQARNQSSDVRSGGLGTRMESAQSPRHQQHPIGSSAAADTDFHGELVCDYDQNVTTLYELLEASQWDQARLRCRTHPEEVQTWIVRRDANGQTRWRLLPLHAAVIFQAPTQVVEGMIKEFPVAAGKRDDQGMLPLHLAFRHKQEDTLLDLLLSHFPQGVTVKDRRDRLPLDHGKDKQFSADIMQKYAEAFVRYQNNRGVEKMNGLNSSQVESLQVQYEGRLAAMAQKHAEDLEDLKLQMEQDQHIVRTQHNQEMDELRDLLSREVKSGQRSRHVETEMQELQDALAKSQAEAQLLRSRLVSQNNSHEELQGHIQKVMSDQKALHTFCVQQQQELEQAQQIREQLLRSLMQKDDGNAVRTSREICQLSDNIRLRTEQILSRTTAATAVLAVESKSHPATPTEGHRSDNPSNWEEHNDNDHGDDISAITDDHF